MFNMDMEESKSETREIDVTHGDQTVRIRLKGKPPLEQEVFLPDGSIPWVEICTFVGSLSGWEWVTLPKTRTALTRFSMFED